MERGDERKGKGRGGAREGERKGGGRRRRQGRER